jgi:probable F420-dependent oxidoreductase
MKFTLTVSMCDASHYLPLAVAAEESGFTSLCVPDSVFYPERTTGSYPYTPDGKRFFPPETPFLEPFVVIPAMAAVTTRLRFFSWVLKLPIRNPLLVAKTLGSAAVLSGNRVGLGVGTSWMPEEFVWCGSDWETRGGRLREAIEIIRAVTRGGMVEYHGKHYDFDRLQQSPAPSAPIPIYVGGHRPSGLRRAAELGDGWCSANTTTAELTGYLARLRGFLADAGRDPARFEILAMCIDVRDRDGFRRLADQGVTDAIVMPWLLDGNAAGLLDPRAPVAGKLDSVRRFGDAIIAKMA